MEIDLKESDELIKKLQKKKKGFYKKKLLKDNVDNNLNTEAIKDTDEDLKQKDNDDVSNTTILKKKNKFSMLNQIHTQYTSSFDNIVSAYETVPNKKPVKRTFIYNNDIVNNKNKPKVVNLEATREGKEKVIEKKEETSLQKQTKYSPDFYFGVSQSMDFFTNKCANVNLSKPILNDELEIINTDVPESVLNKLFQNINTVKDISPEKNDTSLPK
ncbi:hypothetical protein HANVADRAFT_49964 [Hanseniaspora valbyensis NRRL Y-1626]|uniref:Uncharacterized protein n=1 Tax=Hanseniaspora valbyensis NRRL Y-1626 TaxID=766949 RepID=A0A1B7TA04_9ASCO|nr:hypothetical protein HANVADRAFT_49964 [Hanseniaspora valbyensis NRRL Y-1626]